MVASVHHQWCLGAVASPMVASDRLAGSENISGSSLSWDLCCGGDGSLWPTAAVQLFLLSHILIHIFGSSLSWDLCCGVWGEMVLCGPLSFFSWAIFLILVIRIFDPYFDPYFDPFLLSIFFIHILIHIFEPYLCSIILEPLLWGRWFFVARSAFSVEPYF